MQSESMVLPSFGGNGFSDPRTHRGTRRGSRGRARGRQAAGPPRPADRQCEPNRLDRRHRRGALGRAAAADGVESNPESRLAAATRVGRRLARDPGLGLHIAPRAGEPRPRPLRRVARRGPARPRWRRRRARRRAPTRGARSLAGDAPRRCRVRVVRPARDRPPRGATTGGARRANRGRPRSRAARRPRRRARGADRQESAPRATTGPAHARSLSLRASKRGARRISGREAYSRRRARHRAGPPPARAPPGAPQPGSRARPYPGRRGPGHGRSAA